MDPTAAAVSSTVGGPGSLGRAAGPEGSETDGDDTVMQEVERLLESDSWMEVDRIRRSEVDRIISPDPSVPTDRRERPAPSDDGTGVALEKVKEEGEGEGQEAVGGLEEEEEREEEGGGSEGGDEDGYSQEALDDIEDDSFEPWYLRLLNGLLYFFIRKRVEVLRRVTANDPLFNAHYAGNTVITSKYNIITFLPYNLFEQFLRVANFYFLILVILQSIPTLSSVPFYSTLLPLVLVLVITALKDAHDDIKRHISDYQINNRSVYVLKDGIKQAVKWKNVRVGDILRLERNDFVTADLMLLSSSEPSNLVYIDTAELDGETNLKVRQPLPQTTELSDNEAQLFNFNGCIECEPPNNRLHKFVGKLAWKGKSYALDNSNVLLRGCRLRNTKWMYGLVIYAGHDTKLVQNSGRTRFKRTHLDQTVNNLVLLIILFLCFLLFCCFLGSLIFEMLYGTNPAVETFLPREYHPLVTALLQIFSNMIVLNTFVPISLYVRGKLVYNAQSPDEAALISAAKNYGFVLKDRSPFTMTVDMLARGTKMDYEVLNILDFSSERKRMSVIVKSEDKITLYCKGADCAIIPRLSKATSRNLHTTQEHLTEYAREGLRTLMIAKKDICEEDYGKWLEEYLRASIAQTDRDYKLGLVYNKIEQGLTLLGATAIEDKLQDGVPDTIANLAKANIKVWMITGDQLDTAVNIGFSCKLLTETMKIFVINEDTQQEAVKALCNTRKDILSALEKKAEECDLERTGGERGEGGGGGGGAGGREQQRERSPHQAAFGDLVGPPFGIVINGHSLHYILREEGEMFIDVATRCQAVICCRMTPLQKKSVVDLVTRLKKVVTLAIGDGANDVGMIKAAHIGVGISGQEGQQAVLASDYSFGQFRYLERLLLVHGRWSYHRMTIFLRYFFYKNFAFTFSQFTFAFFCGFTAQTLYDSTYITVYNVIYTSLPVVALAILDQDVDEDNCYRYPKLYIAGQQNKSFDSWVFFRSLAKGIYAALVLFLVLLGITWLNVFQSGYEWDYQSFGLAASGALTVIVNLQIAMDTYYWNPGIHLFIWGSILSWFVVLPFTSWELIYAFLGLFLYNGVATQVIASSAFWFYVPLASAIALFPVVLTRSLRLELFPTFLDDVRLKMKKEGRRLFRRKRHKDKSKQTRSTSSVLSRSGYAFSHSGGFGDLISSGRGFGIPRNVVEEQRRERLSVLLSSASSSPVPSGSLTGRAGRSRSGASNPAARILYFEPSHD